MDKSKYSVILSALVLPGLGQIILGHWLKGLVISLSFILLFCWMTIRVGTIIYSGLFAPDTVVDLYVFAETSSLMLTENWWLFLVMIVVWLANIVDAFFTGKTYKNCGAE
jgi:TM2 domain-containing membrane protein YozV